MAKFATFAIAALLPIVGYAQQTVTLRDGTRYTGAMVRADENSVTFRDENGQRRSFDTNQIQSIQFNGDSRSNYDNRGFGGNTNDRNGTTNRDRTRAGNNGDYNGSNYNNGNRDAGYMTIAAGTEMAVRTNESIDVQSGSEGRMYSAQIDRDVTDGDGNVVIPRGSEAQLTVRNTGNRQIGLDLQSVSVNGRRYTVDTGEVTQTSQGREGVGANRRTGEYVGGGAVLGTLLGAIAGGGRGAAIGALAGGAAGAGTQVLTRGSQVKVPAETTLSFRLDNPLRLR